MKDDRGPNSSFPHFISYYLTKSYVVGTQKNHLIETILFSTYNIRSVDQIRNLEQAKHSLSRALDDNTLS